MTTQEASPIYGGAPVPLSSGKVIDTSFFPVDVCTLGLGGCTTGLTVSANADFSTSTTSNPGGFTATAATVPYLAHVTAGRTTFAALGATTLNEAKGGVTLQYANFGPAGG